MLASVKTSLLQSEEWNREERKLNVRFTKAKKKPPIQRQFPQNTF